MYMSDLEKIQPSYYREKLPEFKEKIMEFNDGKVNMKDYKGFSGRFGSYAQRGGKKHMLRLRMSGGRLTKDKLKFTVEEAKKHGVDLVHFTTCQAVQFHDLEPEIVVDIMDKALDADIVCYGGGGDYPRNVMCSPLTGTEPGEYFDVMPYALATADYLMHYIDREKMPRKLKVAFSNSPANMSHATFRDLGFVAREDGKFDVYAAGGLGVNPSFGVKVAEAVDPADVLYYAKAMIHTFRKHGNYAQRTKARTRYMVDALGGPENFAKAFQEELQEALKGEDLHLNLSEVKEVVKTPDGTIEESWKVLPQKQEGLYSVRWHPIGGSPRVDVLDAVSQAIEPMEDVELRLSPDETVYIINLTAKEAEKILNLIADDSAKNEFEASISCIGARICQVGVRDSQGMLDKAIHAVQEAGIADNALPKVHFSGCPSSCGTHQVGSIGFRGGVKLVDKKPVPGFTLFVNGNDRQGEEVMGKEIGALAETDIPSFLIDLGHTVENSGLAYEEWAEANPDGVAEVAAKYIA